jgi:hypothetical protein
MIGIATLAAIPLIVISNNIILTPGAPGRPDVINLCLGMALGNTGLGVWTLVFLDHLHLRRTLMRGEIISLPIKPITVALLVVFALIFGGVASAFSWFTSAAIEDKNAPWADLWMSLHLPAIVAYIGTLAEHDPWKGKGAFIFICLQWAVLGILFGLFAAFLRPAIREFLPRKPLPGPPPLLSTFAR